MNWSLISAEWFDIELGSGKKEGSNWPLLTFCGLCRIRRIETNEQSCYASGWTALPESLSCRININYNTKLCRLICCQNVFHTWRASGRPTSRHLEDVKYAQYWKIFQRFVQNLVSGKSMERHFKRLHLSFLKSKTAAAWPRPGLSTAVNNWSKRFVFKAEEASAPESTPVAVMASHLRSALCKWKPMFTEYLLYLISWRMVLDNVCVCVRESFWLMVLQNQSQPYASIAVLSF